MTWFFAAVVVAVMGAVAVVAAGRGGAMRDVFDDRPDARVQADGPLTAQDLRTVRFSTAFRGYRMSEVDSLLDRLAAELHEAQQQGGSLPPQNPVPEPTTWPRGRHAAEPPHRSESPQPDGNPRR